MTLLYKSEKISHCLASHKINFIYIQWLSKPSMIFTVIKFLLHSLSILLKSNQIFEKINSLIVLFRLNYITILKPFSIYLNNLSKLLSFKCFPFRMLFQILSLKNLIQHIKTLKILAYYHKSSANLLKHLDTTSVLSIPYKSEKCKNKFVSISNKSLYQIFKTNR